MRKEKFVDKSDNNSGAKPNIDSKKHNNKSDSKISSPNNNCFSKIFEEQNTNKFPINTEKKEKELENINNNKFSPTVAKEKINGKINAEESNNNIKKKTETEFGQNQKNNSDIKNKIKLFKESAIKEISPKNLAIIFFSLIYNFISLLI